MKLTPPIGLGEPTPEGKLSLFQPPQSSTDSQDNVQREEKINKKDSGNREIIDSIRSISHPRIRTTIDLTSEALVILQQVQQQYRLKTGKAMPIWKALSLVITNYKKSQTKD